MTLPPPSPPKECEACEKATHKGQNVEVALAEGHHALLAQKDAEVERLRGRIADLEAAHGCRSADHVGQARRALETTPRRETSRAGKGQDAPGRVPPSESGQGGR